MFSRCIYRTLGASRLRYRAARVSKRLSASTHGSTVFHSPKLLGALMLAICVLLAGCVAHASLPSFAVVPDFTLTDQAGAPFSSSAALDGKVWIADFIYTNCPGPCPRMSSQMHQVQTAFEGSNEVRFVSFTVDPARDTPAVLAAYGQHFEANPGKWFFLTGPVPALQHLSRDVFLLGDVDGNLEHSTRFVLVDKKSRVRGFYLSSDSDALPRLVADARSLLRERL
jgi:protein SCO1/2